LDAVDKINAFLDKEGIDQTELAAMAQVSQGRLSEILSRKTKDPKLDHMRRIAKVMHVTIDELIDERLGWPVPKGQGVKVSEEEMEALSAYRMLVRRRGHAYALDRLLGVADSATAGRQPGGITGEPERPDHGKPNRKAGT
jgi:transcriptional regulator with XRE-family HTH domain